MTPIPVTETWGRRRVTVYTCPACNHRHSVETWVAEHIAREHADVTS